MISPDYPLASAVATQLFASPGSPARVIQRFSVRKIMHSWPSYKPKSVFLGFPNSINDSCYSCRPSITQSSKASDFFCNDIHGLADQRK